VSGPAGDQHADPRVGQPAVHRRQVGVARHDPIAGTVVLYDPNKALVS
jgi:hypothetical protein